MVAFPPVERSKRWRDSEQDPLSYDPQQQANDYYPSSLWIDVNCPPGQVCSQIISTVMTEGWIQNQNSYGDHVYDSSGCGAGSCTPENQY